MPGISLVVRGDDAGSCESANAAILEAADAGVLKNVSIMAPGPALESVAPLLVERTELCLGLHVTLNAEWDGPKWRPTLPTDFVRSLVDENGFFWSTPHVSRDRGARPEEMMLEVQAQLQRLRSLGLPITYLDEHMGVGWVGDLRAHLADLARREGLLAVQQMSFSRVPEAPGPIPDCWVAGLDGANPGCYLLVTHPGMDTEEMRQFAHPGLMPGQVARDRNAERQALADRALDERLRLIGVRPVTFLEVTTRG